MLFKNDRQEECKEGGGVDGIPGVLRAGERESECKIESGGVERGLSSLFPFGPKGFPD